MNILQHIIELLSYNPKEPLLFNSGFFLVFFFIFLCIYQPLQKHQQLRIYIIIIFSFYFFYKACGWYVLFMMLAGVIDFFVSKAIHNTNTKKTKKLLLICSVIANLGLLFYFKYTNFFISLVNDWHLGHIQPLHILLPVGISFYTFENLSYTIDVYRGTIKPVKNIATYLAFLSFFPKLMMGPIIRAADFIPQLTTPVVTSSKQVYEGMYLIAGGIIKKVLIADFLYSNYVERIFDNPSLYTGFECIMAVYGYAFVIYGDFAGYSSMALGIAKWIGIELNNNFETPYQSASITEFWRRWHMSLSSWLKDYLYIPLGGNKVSKIRQSINLFTTMLLGGFWHGASYNFIIWGGMHGAVLSIDKTKNSLIKKHVFIQNHINKYKNCYRVLGIITTFHIVCLCWVYFKAATLSQAHQIIHNIYYNFNNGIIIDWLQHYYTIAIVLGLGIVLHSIPKHIEQKYLALVEKKSFWLHMGIFIAIVLTAAYFKTAEPILPVYLQF